MLSPFFQSPTSDADNSSDDSPAVEVGQLSSKRQSATGKAGEAKEQEERASPRRSKRLSARAKRDDSTQRVEEEHGGGASDGGRSAPRDASDSVDRDARERSVSKTSRTVPPRGASRGSASSGDGDDAPSQDDDERRGPNVRSTAVRSARDSGNPARKRDAAPAQSRSEVGGSSNHVAVPPEVLLFTNQEGFIYLRGKDRRPVPTHLVLMLRCLMEAGHVCEVEIVCVYEANGPTQLMPMGGFSKRPLHLMGMRERKHHPSYRCL